MPQFGWGGGESVTVPGAVSAWVALSERYGRLPFERLFGPAIGYAADGYLVSPIVAELWAPRGGDAGRTAGICRGLPAGRPRAAGGRALRQRAPGGEPAGDRRQSGRGVLPRCPGGAGSLPSPTGTGRRSPRTTWRPHRPDWCGTISKGFGDLDLHEIPPNGQGIAALMALGMCRHLGLDGMDPDGARRPAPADRGDEAGAGRRAGLCRRPRRDDRGRAAGRLLDDGYLAERAKAIDPKAASDPGAGAPKQGGTVYISAADERGIEWCR